MTDGTVVAEEKNNATIDATVDDKKKEISASEEDKKTPSDKKEGTKEKKEEKKKEESEEESSDEEPPPGLLDKPVEILYVRREKKNVEFFGKTKPGEEEEVKKGPDYSLGKGVKLADIPYIKYTLDKTGTEDLRVLHTLMYRSKGKKMMVKKNIRAFCGWPWDKDSKEYNSVITNTIDRMTVPSLKWTLDLLGVERSGTDTQGMRDALCEFLLKPYASEKKVPEKSKPKSKGKSKKKSAKSKASVKSKSKKKFGDDDEDEDSGDVSDDVSEEEEQEEKKPKKKTPAKKAPPKKKPAAKKNTKKSAEVSDVSEPSDDSDSSDSDDDEESKKKTKKAPAKKAPAKKSPAKKRKAESDDSDEEEDEPLMKKSNGSPPTDTELKDTVKALLKDTDLEQVTMKTVIKQVYDKFSSYDLTSRKDFIKGSVKELIS